VEGALAAPLTGVVEPITIAIESAGEDIAASNGRKSPAKRLCNDPGWLRAKG
jgi:hypothetical protein